MSFRRISQISPPTTPTSPAPTPATHSLASPVALAPANPELLVELGVEAMLAAAPSTPPAPFDPVEPVPPEDPPSPPAMPELAAVADEVEEDMAWRGARSISRGTSCGREGLNHVIERI